MKDIFNFDLINGAKIETLKAGVVDLAINRL